MTGLFTGQGERKYVTEAEGWRLLECAGREDPVLQAFCAVLVFCGCRVSEALGLYRSHVDREQLVIRFRTLKRRNGAVVWRAVPVPPELIELLLSLPASTQEPIFAWSRSTAWRRVGRLMAQAGIEGHHASPKGLRHRFGIVAAGEGVPVALIQRWMGHSKLENTLIYMQAVGNEERLMAAKLWAQPRSLLDAGFTLEGVGAGDAGSD